MKQPFIVAVLGCILASALVGCSAGTRAPLAGASSAPVNTSASAANMSNPSAAATSTAAMSTTASTSGGSAAPAASGKHPGPAASGTHPSKPAIKSPKAATNPVIKRPTTHRAPTKADAAMFAKFKEITAGMSLNRVAAIIGSPGTKNGRTRVGKYDVVMYTWQVPRGTGIINVMFALGKVTTKAQFGLH